MNLNLFNQIANFNSARSELFSQVSSRRDFRDFYDELPLTNTIDGQIEKASDSDSSESNQEQGVQSEPTRIQTTKGGLDEYVLL